MQSGCVTDSPLAELFGSLVAQRASGCLEVVQDKRKRRYWFEDGQLSFTKSNLRSETIERIDQRSPGMDRSELLHAQVELRLRNAMSLQDGQWTFTPNVPPPKRAVVPLLPILAKLVMEKLSSADIDARFAGLGARFPRRATQSNAPDSLGLSPEATELIESLDGGRPLEDVLEFAPIEPARARRTIYLALITGILEFNQDEATLARISAAPEAEATQVESVPSPTASAGSLADLFDAAIVSSPKVPETASLSAGQSASAEQAVVRDSPGIPTVDPDLAPLRKELSRVEQAEDYFEILGVHWDTDEASYRKAYFALAQRLHPDRWTSASGEVQSLAADIFAKVSEAWQELGDAQRKQVYIDRIIHGVKSEDELAMEKVRAILEAEDEFKAGLSMFRRGNLMRAHELFEKAHRAVPEEAEFQAYYGYTLFKKSFGKDDGAAQDGVNLIKAAIDKHVKLDAGWVLMGLVFRTAGSHKRARGAFRKALEMNNSNVEAERELRRSVQDLQREKARVAKEEKKKAGFFGRFFKK